jgi:uncharacterized protein
MAIAALPKYIDPFQFAEHKRTFVGELCLADMVRLQEIVCDKNGIVNINLEFGYDVSKYPFVRGSIQGQFTLLCQRCNGPLLLPLDIVVALSPVRTDEEAELLPEEYEPLLVVEDTVSIATLVEEEILLSIPIVPRHSEKECPGESTHIEWEEEKDKTNPFADLKKLLRE